MSATNSQRPAARWGSRSEVTTRRIAGRCRLAAAGVKAGETRRRSARVLLALGGEGSSAGRVARKLSGSAPSTRSKRGRCGSGGHAGSERHRDSGARTPTSVRASQWSSPGPRRRRWTPRARGRRCRAAAVRGPNRGCRWHRVPSCRLGHCRSAVPAPAGRWHLSGGATRRSPAGRRASRGRAPLDEGAQRVRAVLALDVAHLEGPVGRPPAVSLRSKGLTPRATSESSSHAPASRERTSVPSCVLTRPPPWRPGSSRRASGLQTKTSLARHRRHRAVAVVGHVEHDRLPPGCPPMLVDLGRGLLDRLAVGAGTRRPLSATGSQHEVDDLVVPLRVRLEQLVVGPEPRRMSSRARPGRRAAFSWRPPRLRSSSTPARDTASVAASARMLAGSGPSGATKLRGASEANRQAGIAVSRHGIGLPSARVEAARPEPAMPWRSSAAA